VHCIVIIDFIMFIVRTLNDERLHGLSADGKTFYKSSTDDNTESA
jgi:hypothetical protein